MQHDTSPFHRVDQAVDGGLLNVVPTPLQWLYEVDGYWRELEHSAVNVDPGHPEHAQWVTCLVSMQAVEELGHFQLPGILYGSLRHGACIITLKH